MTSALLRRAQLLAALIAVAAVTPSDAGTFEAQTPTYGLSLSPTSLLVIVNGQAIYRGNWDSNDHHAFIQTTAYAVPGDPQGNAGNGYNKYASTTNPFWNGYVLPCRDSQGGCPGRIYIARPYCQLEPDTFYHGRTGVVIYHQYSPEIDTEYGNSQVVPCAPGGPTEDDPCDPPINPFVLPVVGGPQLTHALPDSRTETLRRERRGSTLYVMDEWAVLAVDQVDGRVQQVEALAASSSSYGAFRRDGLVEGIEITRAARVAVPFELHGKAPLDSYFRPGRSILLAVDEPVHVHNHRWIEKPVPRLLPQRSPVVHGGETVAVVRAEYSEDRTLDTLDVLYADRRLTRSELSHLETHLTLEYASDKLHRAVLFAVLRLGGTVAIEVGRAVVPQCCCPNPDPETGQCQGPEV